MSKRYKAFVVHIHIGKWFPLQYVYLMMFLKIRKNFFFVLSFKTSFTSYPTAIIQAFVLGSECN